MKPLIRWALFLAVPLLLVLSLSAGAGVAPAAKAQPVKPRTLVTAKGLMHGFAQDGKAIAWIAGPLHRPWSVYVRGPNARKTWVVGKVDETDYEVPGRVITRPLALAGTRALWTTFTGGASWVYTDVATGAPGMRQLSVNEYEIWEPGPDESPVPEVVGDGTTLAYGVVLEGCRPENPWDIPRACAELYSGPGNGVVVVAHAYNPPAIGGIAPPVMLALSQGRVAVVPAASPRRNDGYGPRPVENGPVAVYDLSGQLLSTVHPIGTVREVALAWPTLSVIVERPDGTKALELYDVRAPQGTAVANPMRISLGATDLAASEVGTVFRVGSRIYFRPGRPHVENAVARSVCQADSTPIGLSIEGHRIAWAVNVKGQGRVVALTVP